MKTFGTYPKLEQQNTKENLKNPFRKSIKIHLLDLARKGIEHELHHYEKDVFVSLAQWLFHQDCPIQHVEQSELLNGFFNNLLFSLSPTGVIYGSEILKWREKLDISKQIFVNGLKFYRNYFTVCAAVKTNLFSLGNIESAICGKFQNEKLGFRPNSSHKNAVWILSKSIVITKDYLYYNIAYSTKKQYEISKSGKSCANWQISIKSKFQENYIDFVWRIYKHYEYIMQGERHALKHIWGKDTGSPVYELRETAEIKGTFLIKKEGFCSFNYAEFDVNAFIGGRNIEDFALSNPKIALKILRDASNMPFKMQDIKPPKGEYFTLQTQPKEIKWECLLLNDAVPCKATLCYDYILKCWDWDAVAVYDDGCICRKSSYF